MKSTRITFFGSGSAFVLSSENYHSNIFIENGEDNCLFDVGTTIFDAMDSQGISEMNIKKIFISHLHGDHSGGIEMFGFKRHFYSHPIGSNKPDLFSFKKIISNLWKKQIGYSMKSVDKKANLNTFFNVNFLDKDGSFNIGDITAELIKTKHTSIPSFGIYLKEPRIFISGDTKFTPNRFYKIFKEANVIFHDCEFAEYDGGYHAQFHELNTLPDNIKIKMYLYHYQLYGRAFEEVEKEVLAAGFRGLVPRGFSINIGGDKDVR